MRGNSVTSSPLFVEYAQMHTFTSPNKDIPEAKEALHIVKSCRDPHFDEQSGGMTCVEVLVE